MGTKQKRQTIIGQLRTAIAKEESMNSLSRKSGVSVPSITRFVLDERSLTLETAAKLCTSLGLELAKK